MVDLKRELKNQTAIVGCARQFGVVGDPTRLKICYLLCNHPELSVTEMADAIGISVSAVSHSLKKLKSANLVESKRDFRTVHYTWIDKAIAKVLKDQISQFRGDRHGSARSF